MAVLLSFHPLSQQGFLANMKLEQKKNVRSKQAALACLMCLQTRVPGSVLNYKSSTDGGRGVFVALNLVSYTPEK